MGLMPHLRRAEFGKKLERVLAKCESCVLRSELLLQHDPAPAPTDTHTGYVEVVRVQRKKLPNLEDFDFYQFRPPE
jgi:hypothetical protein